MTSTTSQLPAGFEPITLLLPALPVFWVCRRTAVKFLGGFQVVSANAEMVWGIRPPFEADNQDVGYVNSLFAEAFRWPEFIQASAADRARMLSLHWAFNHARGPNRHPCALLLDVGWNATTGQFWVAPRVSDWARFGPLALLRRLAGESSRTNFVHGRDNIPGMVYCHTPFNLPEGLTTTVDAAAIFGDVPWAHHQCRGAARSIQIKQGNACSWQDAISRAEEVILTRLMAVDPGDGEDWSQVIGPSWWRRDVHPELFVDIDVSAEEHNTADTAGLDETLVELEDTVSELCDQAGIPVTDDSTPLSRLLQLQTALTSAQAQSGADPQMALSSLAVALLDLFYLLGVPALDGERGLTLHERVSRAVAVVRQGRAETASATHLQAHARLTASEEERQHLTAQLQQARTAVDAWTIECSRLAGQVTDLQARLAAAVEDAGSGVQARVAHALREELNQVGILMSQGYLSPAMHAAVARVHWLMDLYHGPR